MSGGRDLSGSRDVTVWRGLGEVPAGTRAAATIGVFDGVHLGHQALMRTTVDAAERRDVVPVAVTFDRHPLEVIAPEHAPKILSTLDQRARAMAACGIEAVLILTFDDVFRHLSPEDFVRHVLVDKLHCVHAIVGANFRFGHKQSGTIETLNDIGQAFGFDVTIVALHQRDGEVISSNLIRGHITDGLVERAAEELGRPYAVEGIVEHGAKRGRDLGFPTANLSVPDRIQLPKLGVYAGWLRRRDERHPCVTNVGVNPTFGGRSTPVVEAFVIDFDDDLYGETVEVEFTDRLRDELRFEGADALVEQMHLDVANARALLGV